MSCGRPTEPKWLFNSGAAGDWCVGTSWVSQLLHVLSLKSLLVLRSLHRLVIGVWEPHGRPSRLQFAIVKAVSESWLCA